MILILARQQDDHADAVQAELEARGVSVGRLDPVRPSRIVSRTVDVSEPCADDPISLDQPSSAGHPATPAISAIWICQQDPFNISPVLNRLWQSLDVPVLPGRPEVITIAADENIQVDVARRLGFAVRGSFAREGRDPDKPIVEQAMAENAKIIVTVVGEDVTASAVSSPLAHRHLLDWWQYDKGRTVVRRHKLTQTDKDRCLRLVHELGLEYAAMDFSRGENGELAFVGLDPYGQLRWIEETTGLPAAKTIASLLIRRASGAVKGPASTQSNSSA